MSDDYRGIEIITGTERRRRWSAAEKLRIVEETLTGGDSVSAKSALPLAPADDRGRDSGGAGRR